MPHHISLIPSERADMVSPATLRPGRGSAGGPSSTTSCSNIRSPPLEGSAGRLQTSSLAWEGQEQRLGEEREGRGEGKGGVRKSEGNVFFCIVC